MPPILVNSSASSSSGVETVMGHLLPSEAAAARLQRPTDPSNDGLSGLPPRPARPPPGMQVEPTTVAESTGQHTTGPLPVNSAFSSDTAMGHFMTSDASAAERLQQPTGPPQALGPDNHGLSGLPHHHLQPTPAQDEDTPVPELLTATTVPTEALTDDETPVPADPPAPATEVTVDMTQPDFR
jgi:hypothetical protein